MSIIWKSNNTKVEDNRLKLINFLKEEKRKNPKYKVLDIGGVSNPWADDCVDAYVDYQEMSNKKIIVGDILSESTWEKIDNEKFDFCICSHTLEDIRDPKFVINKITTFFSKGYIAVPNKHTELSHVESTKYLGYGHHRYIFSLQENESLIAISKLVILNQFINRILYLPGIDLLIKISKKISKNNVFPKSFKSNVPWIDTKINNSQY